MPIALEGLISVDASSLGGVRGAVRWRRDGASTHCVARFWYWTTVARCSLELNQCPANPTKSGQKLLAASRVEGPATERDRPYSDLHIRIVHCRHLTFSKQ